MTPIKIAIAFEQEFVREGIISLLKSVKEFEVTAKAANGTEALEVLIAQQPSVIFLDYDLSPSGGCDIARQAVRKGYRGQFIVVSSVDNEEYGRNCFRSGVGGFLLYSSTKDELITAVYEVLEGNHYICSQFSKVLLRSFLRRESEAEGHGHLQKLTDRESAILRYVAQGLTSKEIADIMFLSRRTIDYHRRNIMMKLDIRDLPTLVRFAVGAGIVDLPSLQKEPEKKQLPG